MLAAALPDGEEDLGLLALDDTDVHVDMADVLGEGSPRASNADDTGLDGDLDALGDIEFFNLLDVQHLDSESSQDLCQVRPSDPSAPNLPSPRNRANRTWNERGGSAGSDSRRSVGVTYLEGGFEEATSSDEGPVAVVNIQTSKGRIHPIPSCSDRVFSPNRRHSVPCTSTSRDSVLTSPFGVVDEARARMSQKNRFTPAHGRRQAASTGSGY